MYYFIPGLLVPSSHSSPQHHLGLGSIKILWDGSHWRKRLKSPWMCDWCSSCSPVSGAVCVVILKDQCEQMKKMQTWENDTPPLILGFVAMTFSLRHPIQYWDIPTNHPFAPNMYRPSIWSTWINLIMSIDFIFKMYFDRYNSRYPLHQTTYWVWSCEILFFGHPRRLIIVKTPNVAQVRPCKRFVPFDVSCVYHACAMSPIPGAIHRVDYAALWALREQRREMCHFTRGTRLWKNTIFWPPPR